MGTRVSAAPVESSGVYSPQERVELRPFRTEGSVTVDPVGLLAPPWLRTVVDRFNYLVMDAGARIAPEVIRQFLHLIVDPWFVGTPEPLVGPAGDQGLAVEFENGQTELIIEFVRGGAPWVYARRPGHEYEGPLDTIPDGIEKWAWRLAQPLD